MRTHPQHPDVRYQLPWDGYVLPGDNSILAMDTETELRRDDGTIPTIALASVSNGRSHAILMPDQLVPFLEAHYRSDYVFHNVGFDYWVIHSTIRGVRPYLLPSLVDQNQVHDSMLLDLLVRLATIGKGELHPRNLDQVCQEYAGMEIAKDNPYRLRFSELIGKTPYEVDDRGFYDYAVLDVVGLMRAWPALEERAKDLVDKFGTGGDVVRDATQRFGLLTEFIQVRAAIALEDTGRRGMMVDQSALNELATGILDSINDKVRWIDATRPGLLQRNAKGAMLLDKKSGLPKFSTKALRQVLLGLEKDHGLNMPRTGKTKDIATVDSAWVAALPDNEFIKGWSELSYLRKQWQFVTKLRPLHVARSRYRTLVSTGRAGCSNINIQQIPREPEFRHLFVAPPGKRLAIIDYSVIELRTLASVMLNRYGRSALADVLMEGQDPHVNTACLLMGLDRGQFAQLPPSEQKLNRQMAKALNFGIPGGLAKNKLGTYAWENYGIRLSVSDADKFRTKIITEVYPELSLYLADTAVQSLADNLGLDVGQVLAALDARADNSLASAGICKIIRGTAYKADGTPYNEWWVDRIWTGLGDLVSYHTTNLPDWCVKDIQARRGSEQMESLLMTRPISTMTGRIRADVSYTESRNTPFQGLAADGAKLALWELLNEGFSNAAFIHDECVLVVGSEEEGLAAKRVMERAMEQVMMPGIPCVCELTISDRWSKV